MAVKASKKAVRLNFFYSIGAAIVIGGALCKINHYAPLGIDGSHVLAAGMIMEVIVFIVFALDKPSGQYDWEKVYPELTDGTGISHQPIAKGIATQEEKISLSEKLDEMLREAKLDASLFERLRTGIEGFGDSVQELNKTTSAASATQQYGDQLALAANHMESLNALYQVQLESGKRQNEINEKFIEEIGQSSESSNQFLAEMKSLTENIQSLNKVYGGMLSAMKSN